MKKLSLLLIALVGLVATTQAQTYLGVEGALTSKTPVASLHIGHAFTNNIYTEGEMRFHIDRTNPAYFGAKAGYIFKIEFEEQQPIEITPMIGYYYALQSTDNKGDAFDKTRQNGWRMLEGLRVRKGWLFGEVNYLNQTPHFGVGVIGKL